MPWITAAGPLSEYVFFTTVRIETVEPDGGECVGTGFFYTVPRPSTDETQTFMVTNRHMVETATRIELNMLRQDHAGEPLPGKDTGFVIDDAQDGPCWHGHPDPRVDVAVIPLSMALHGFIAHAPPEIRPHISTVDPHQAMSPAGMQRLPPLEEVVMVGYPGGLYDTTNLTPIARRGVIATPPNLDYKGLPAFVIDVSVFGGSSGSPVYLLEPELTLLGILASDEAIEEYTGAGDTYELGLNVGIVFKAWTIDECIEDLRKRWSASRSR